MITFTSISKAAGGVWRYTWASTGASIYRVVLNGEVIEETTNLFYEHAIPSRNGMPPPIEVMPDNQAAVSEQNRPYMVIQWYPVPCAFYDVDIKKANGDWERLTTVAETGLWVYTVVSALLDDETIYQFRLSAVDENKQRSGYLNFSMAVVRCPDSYLGNLAYDNGTQIVSIS